MGNIFFDTSCENQFNLSHHRWEGYRDTRFYKQDRTVVIKWCLNIVENIVEEDVSGLTFQEWTTDFDTSRPPVVVIMNSSELRVTVFKIKEVIPPALETSGRGDLWTRGSGL